MLLPYNLEGNDMSMLIYRIPKFLKYLSFHKLFEKRKFKKNIFFIFLKNNIKKKLCEKLAILGI